jgi:hypothetical protein
MGLMRLLSMVALPRRLLSCTIAVLALLITATAAWAYLLLGTGGGGGGGPTPPTEAVVAGFTTPIILSDFTSSAYANTSTWLDCAGASSPIWFHDSGVYGGYGPCPTIVNDGNGHSQVLKMELDPTPVNSTGPANFLVLYDSGTSTGIMAPTNNYAEATIWVALAPTSANISNFWFGGLGEIPSGVHNYLEFDAFEIDGTISSGAQSSNSRNYYGGINAFPSNWYSSYPPNYSGFDPTACGIGTCISPGYHTIGERTTSDGTTLYKCIWVDGIFQSCINVSVGTANLQSFQLGDTSSRMQTYIQFGENAVTEIASPVVAYLMNFYMWSCAGWTTTACKTSSADPGGY